MLVAALITALLASAGTAWYLGYTAGRRAERNAYARYKAVTTPPLPQNRGGVVLRTVKLQRKPHV